MKLSYLEKPSKIPLAYLNATQNNLIVTETIEVILSDGRILEIPEGYVVKLSEKPSWLKCVLNPFGPSCLAALIHHRLWTEQVSEIENFGSIRDAFRFSNEEFYRWSKKLVPKKKYVNLIKYRLLNSFAMSHYIKRKTF